MTRSEIVQSYREAKDKKTQIKILSELTCKSVNDIENILVAAGETLPPRRKRAEKPAEKPVEKAEEPKKEPIHGKFTEALEKDIKEKVENTPRKFKENIPENVRTALTNELRRLDAQMEEIQKKKAEIIEFMIDEKA